MTRTVGSRLGSMMQALMLIGILSLAGCGGGGGGSTPPHTRNWTHPLNLSDSISPAGPSAFYARAAMGGSGSAIVAWEQWDGANMQIFMSEYRNGSWDHPSDLDDNISPDGPGVDEGAQMAMDASGNAIIVWHQSDGADIQIFMSEYRNGSWDHPSDLDDNISPAGQSALNPQVAMDGAGNAIIVWQQFDGVAWRIFMSEYRGGTWTHPSDLNDRINLDGQDAVNPQVAMDGAGNATIVWVQRDHATGYDKIYMSEYRGGIWAHPLDVDDNINPDGIRAYTSPQVAMDGSGNTIVVWQQSDGINDQIFMSEYRGGTWTHPSDLNDNISPDGQSAYSPKVAMGRSGDAVVVWEQLQDGIERQIYKSEYRGGTWTHPSDLNDNISPDGLSAYYPMVAMDGSGNTIVVWEQSDGISNQIFMSEYRGGTWTHPSGLVDNISPAGEKASLPYVAADTSGNAIIVWEQYDGTDWQIFMSEYR